jgi:hypothetical protein
MLTKAKAEKVIASHLRGWLSFVVRPYAPQAAKEIVILLERAGVRFAE